MPKGCAEDDSNFIGMGATAFYPEDRNGRMLQNVDNMALHPRCQ